ncbi:hypothetical protein [Leptospira noguchii]|uniref:hypothetical protein n=1 Tax=Leptospira noguchii TaxID=28182 RepID=UPI000248BD7C|nr:hypothetical protein [Leptospira noguchii]EKR74713.1 hypothetical protein LEP1GSC041_0107 [Leptospira noguchii str. 2006001870]UOG32726.1 hypothetical protein MAL06_20595 [Leptospira noguchii]UOG36283.1 hypothetical protein MAL02_19150 [Leptospira noguchii]UOG47246.1 hypothetical protein MAL01_19545 [Leptospira noguchii]
MIQSKVTALFNCLDLSALLTSSLTPLNTLKKNTLLHLKTILSLLGEEIVGKVREEYEILNPTKTCDLV